LANQASTVLFTTCPTAESAAVKAFIRQKGLSDLGAPSQIVPVAELPLIGSGKIDYVTLKKMAEEKVNDS
jgi:acyl-[acyl-carrier-protein]-phospholipid O-acyltransferase/long-chain-fatty-acid--[acyl-carrier-protein] ligase